jgi:hypothetical protein
MLESRLYSRGHWLNNTSARNIFPIFLAKMKTFQYILGISRLSARFVSERAISRGAEIKAFGKIAPTSLPVIVINNNAGHPPKLDSLSECPTLC